MKHVVAVLSFVGVICACVAGLDQLARLSDGPVQIVVVSAAPGQTLTRLGNAGGDLRVSGVWLGGHVIGLQGRSSQGASSLPGLVLGIPGTDVLLMPACL